MRVAAEHCADPKVRVALEPMVNDTDIDDKDELAADEPSGTRTRTVAKLRSVG